MAIIEQMVHDTTRTCAETMYRVQGKPLYRNITDEYTRVLRYVAVCGNQPLDPSKFALDHARLAEGMVDVAMRIRYGPVALALAA